MVVVNEITIVEILITVIVFIIACLIILFLSLYPFIKQKIHSSYHKGYNEARNDKHNYYQTIRELQIDFNILTNKLKYVSVELDTAQLIIEYNDKLDKFKNKY